MSVKAKKDAVGIKKIESLTPEQEELLKQYQKTWIDYALSNKRGDKKIAETQIVKAYEAAGLRPPKVIFWTPSPKAAKALYFKLFELWRAWKPKQKDKKPDGPSWTYGCHDALWLGFYAYYDEVLKVPLEKIRPLIELAKHCGWIITCDDVVIMSEKPTSISVDQRYRLHSTTGVAISYEDSSQAYAIEGLEVPEHWVLNPQTITQREVLEQKNQELRRIALNQLGTKNFFDKKLFKKVHVDDFGTLWRCTFEDGLMVTMVEVVNGTKNKETGKGEEYLLMVPNNMERSKQAVAWNYFKKEDE